MTLYSLDNLCFTSLFFVFVSLLLRRGLLARFGPRGSSQRAFEHTVCSGAAFLRFLVAHFRWLLSQLGLGGYHGREVSHAIRKRR